MFSISVFCNKSLNATILVVVIVTVRSGDCTIDDFATFHQVASIEGATLLAPKGLHDELADSFALACVAREKTPGDGPCKAVIPERARHPDLFGSPPQDWDERSGEKKPGLWTRQPTRLFG